MDKTLKRIIWISIILAFFATLFIVFVGYQVITTNNSHTTFEGYCKWRGLEVVNKSLDYGYCKDNYGNLFKMIKVNDRWYLSGDGPGDGW